MRIKREMKIKNILIGEMQRLRKGKVSQTQKAELFKTHVLATEKQYVKRQRKKKYQDLYTTKEMQNECQYAVFTIRLHCSIYNKFKEK